MTVRINGIEYSREVKLFSELSEGDLVMSPSGLVEISEAFDEHLPDSMFEITTEDGSVIEASGNHLFYIETGLDIASHRLRCKNGRRFLKSLSSDTVDLLKEWAAGGPMEIRLSEFVEEVGLRQSSEGSSVIARAAESLGPVTEHSIFLETFVEDGVIEHSFGGVIPAYDRDLLAQQVLSFSRKFPWKTIVGRVVPAQTLASFEGEYWIPALG